MEFDTLLDFISPVPGHETYDYVLYAMFFLGMLTLTFMGKGSSQMDTIFVTLSVFLVVLDKLYITGFLFQPENVVAGAEITNEQRVAVHIDHFVTYCIRVAIFVLPLVVAGNTKNNRTRIIAGLYAMVGFGYSFGRWFFEIRANADDGGSLGMAQGVESAALAGGLALYVLVELAHRWRQQHLEASQTTPGLAYLAPPAITDTEPQPRD